MTGHNLVHLQSSNERANPIYFLYIPIPHRLRESPRVWALEASVRGSYARFIDFSTPKCSLVGKREQTGPKMVFTFWFLK